jgi:hypothetical protein
MADLLYLLITCLFFVFGSIFLRGCDRLYSEESNG